MAQGVGIAIDAARINLIETINRRTSVWTAIGVNLAAWIITLAITVLLLVAVYLPNWQAALLEHVKAVQTSPSPSAQAAPAPAR